MLASGPLQAPPPGGFVHYLRLQINGYECSEPEIHVAPGSRKCHWYSVSYDYHPQLRQELGLSVPST